VNGGIIMEVVLIEWAQSVVPFHQIKDFKSETCNLDRKGFYVILSGTKTAKGWVKPRLLYVGQAFDQTLRERIPQERMEYQCVYSHQKAHAGAPIWVMIGFIKETSVGRVNQQLFDDIECCLIFSNQPMCNTACKDSYSGRDLEVINVGHYAPLEERCTCLV
jgi:hypothetical protein